MTKHILFDCDGVLIDTEIVAAEVVTRWLNQQGVVIDTETFIHQFTGKTFSDILALLVDSGKLAPQLEIKKAVAAMDTEIRANMRPISGVEEMLASVPLQASMVSNSATDYVLEAIEMLGAEAVFGQRVFSAELVAKGKPDPAVYLLALQKLGLKPSEVVVVEDSVAGVSASVAAGLRTIGFLGGSHVRHGHGAKLKALGAEQLVSNHEELQKLLQQV
ncbi:HAD family phosphatase [Roseivirga sp. UBA838]|uniref:HAD family hydrolase n=1 Tax=Roseivirga sp. UBA838 TaxID=1947393 RepID=UPI00258049FE|nr:HAD family phosphatase [Roseivirga sp. UBA838]|tara:strand:+ start:3491 stop:4144 length:654 start_codon:yes stop_codon:yes gene_type:complete